MDIEPDHHPNPSPSGLRALRTRIDRVERELSRMERAAALRESDIRAFIEGLTIVDKQGRRTSLIMNPAQEIVYHKLIGCRERRVPARFICCKARQMGVSTLIAAYVFALAVRAQDRNALLIAHTLESAKGLFTITRRMLQETAKRFLFTAAVSARHIRFGAPHNSHLSVDTANNRALGRGATIHYVHASEVAFWERPEEPSLAVTQAVPNHWDTLIFWESTANGTQNLFHRTWIAAERGETDMEPIFLSWKEFPEYFLPLSPTIAPDAEETEYARVHGLAPERLAWAVETKRNRCANSWDTFHQEYPVTAELAFTFSGMPWFDSAALMAMWEAAEPAPYRGDFRFDADDRPEFVENPAGLFHVWRLPEPGRDYCIGMDVGEGVGGDYTVIQVMEAGSGELVATAASNVISPQDGGVAAYLAGRFYNSALLAIERNGPGLASLTVCRYGSAERPGMTPYPRLYHHTYMDRSSRTETKRLGWVTDRITKETALTRLAHAVAHGRIVIRSRRALSEMLGFVRDEARRTFRQQYKAPGAKSAHDDEIMALAIANEMRELAAGSAAVPVEDF